MTFSFSEAIEVLVFSRAFVVKKFGRGAVEKTSLKTGQVTWAKHGGPGPAWELAKQRANF